MRYAKGAHLPYFDRTNRLKFQHIILIAADTPTLKTNITSCRGDSLQPSKIEKTRIEMKRIVSNTPVIGPIARYIYRFFTSSKPPQSTFNGSESYWIERYKTGGNSGDGSYNQLAEFKADTINTFVAENSIESIIEYGCGDGNQLTLAIYPNYTGFDISSRALSMCLDRFKDDHTKTFKLIGSYAGEIADLTLSLDVIYHLVEDAAFSDYMRRLLDSSRRYVIIYSSNTDKTPDDEAPHVKHRNFSRWIEDNKPEWRLIKHLPNKYPFNGDTKSGSFADFYFYVKS